MHDIQRTFVIFRSTRRHLEKFPGTHDTYCDVDQYPIYGSSLLGFVLQMPILLEKGTYIPALSLINQLVEKAKAAEEK